MHAGILSTRSSPRRPQDHRENEKYMLIATNGAGTIGHPYAEKEINLDIEPMRRDPKNGIYL